MELSQARAKPAWWLPALGMLALIWVLSSGEKTPGPSLVHPLDWAAHFLAYLALGFTLGKATGRPALGWVLAAWFGALDEVHQAFVPPREAGITDWVFDLMGSYLGVRLALPRRQRTDLLALELEFTSENAGLATGPDGRQEEGANRLSAAPASRVP